MTITIDGQEILSKAKLFEFLKEELHAPEDCGNNLDAIHDILTEKNEEMTVEILHADILVDSLTEKYAMSLFEMLLSSNVKLIVHPIQSED